MSPEVSIIVPTINEAANLPTLVRRIAGAMTAWDYELLVIDDGSNDRTADVCGELSRTFPLALHVRATRANGLSGAVLYGFARAKGNLLIVMDADLQHPPEALPALIAPLTASATDFVIGSRRVDGGRVVASWAPTRRLMSLLAAWLAMPLIGTIHDPLSGFFALRRTTWEQAKSLDPVGYKIGLELMCKCPIQKVQEVPILFGVRLGGNSKLSFAQQLNYVKHLCRLYAAWAGGRLVRPAFVARPNMGPIAVATHQP